MKKTFEQFVKDYNIDLTKCELCSSETQFYEGSNVHITYISLNKTIDGQDWHVLSKKLATKFYKNNDVKVLKEADAVFDEEHGWGLICHSSIKKLNVDLSNIFTDSSKSENALSMEIENKDRDESDLNKLKESLYWLKTRIDEKVGYVRPYKYDYVIIDTTKYIADINYVSEDEYGNEYGTSHLSGVSFSTSILDNIENFIEKFDIIMLCRERAQSLDIEIYSYAERAMKREPKPDIIIDFPKDVIALDDNYLSETEEHIYRITSDDYIGIDDNGYDEVVYNKIRGISRNIIEDYYNIDLYEVEHSFINM